MNYWRIMFQGEAELGLNLHSYIFWVLYIYSLNTHSQMIGLYLLAFEFIVQE